MSCIVNTSMGQCMLTPTLHPPVCQFYKLAQTRMNLFVPISSPRASQTEFTEGRKQKAFHARTFQPSNKSPWLPSLSSWKLVTRILFLI